MKKFDFRLETVLKVRKQEESVRRKELTEEEQHLQAIRERVARLQKENDEIEESLRHEKGRSLNPEELAANLSYLYSVQEQMVNSQDDLMRQKNVTEFKRREVQEAQRKKKMIENLKDKRYLQWKKEGEAFERKAMDEMAIFRHARNQGDS